jgi:hypothetical protein
MRAAIGFTGTPDKIGTFGIAIDLGATAILFIGFYVAALLISTFGIFLLFVAAFHAVDICWFLLGRRVTTCRPHVQEVTAISWFMTSLRSCSQESWAVVWVRSISREWFQAATAAILFLMFESTCCGIAAIGILVPQVGAEHGDVASE